MTFDQLNNSANKTVTEAIVNGESETTTPRFDTGRITKSRQEAEKQGKARELKAAAVESGVSQADLADDEVILNSITQAAKASVRTLTQLADSVKEAISNDIEKDSICAAIVAGGWSESRAKSFLSEMNISMGNRQRKKRNQTVNQNVKDWADKLLEFCQGNRKDAAKLAGNVAYFLRKKSRGEEPKVESASEINRNKKASKKGKK